MLLCNFFAINLFIGVLLNNFKEQKSKQEGEKKLFMTDAQYQWVKSMNVVRTMKPLKVGIEPRNKILGLFYRLSHSIWFDTVILFAIFGNVIILYMAYFGAPDEHLYIIDTINFACTCIFIIEAIIKIFGLGKTYFYSYWNVFDFALVVGSSIGIYYYFLIGAKDILLLNIARVFRVFRAFRMLEGFRYSKILVDTLINTLPSLANISALLFLFIYIFAIIGIQCFAKIEYYGYYNQNANFRKISTSILSLLRFSTGENWGSFMFDVFHNGQSCVPDPQYDPDMCGFEDKPDCIPLNGCGSVLIIPYIVIFEFFFSICMFNLFASVIIEGKYFYTA